MSAPRDGPRAAHAACVTLSRMVEFSIDPIGLLADLVAAKSYSGQEGPAADVMEAALRRAGLAPQRIGHNVICTRGRGSKTLLFNSHLDTVPASDRWTRDPWKPEIVDGRLYGLGATDAKSCVAAMAAAFAAASDPGDRGRLIFTATTEEETGGASGPDGLETVLPTLGRISAGIVGEPTKLNICNGQRGLVRAFLRAIGQAGHASRPWEGSNAIEKAAEDILAIKRLAAEVGEDYQDPAAGKPTIQCTVIAGGTAPNVIPDRCDITLDVRTTRFWGNNVAISTIRSVVRSELEVKSARFLPVSTDPEDPIILAARAALPDAQLRPFGGVSDLFFLVADPAGPVPAILIGPGDGQQSHQPDEFVSVEMVRRAAAAYREIASRYLS
ncbi:MAG: acetylornithine deacetylase [Planctomycetota bacterium]